MKLKIPYTFEALEYAQHLLKEDRDLHVRDRSFNRVSVDVDSFGIEIEIRGPDERVEALRDALEERSYFVNPVGEDEDEY